MVLNAVMALALELVPQSAVAPGIAGAAGPAGERPDSAQLARLGSELAGARRIRVTLAGRRVELERPVPADDGVRFARAIGFPAPRPALVTAGEPGAAPPPNPVPWSAIERLERAEKRWGPGGVLGGGLGFWGGLTLGFAAGYTVWAVTENRLAAGLTLAGVSAGGAVLGSYAMGRYTEWVEIYPAQAAASAGSDPARSPAGRE